MRDIDNAQDVLDSRDIIARIEELEAEREAFAADKPESPQDVEFQVWNETTEGGEELAKLLALQSEAKDYSPDWAYGATLIRDTYFTDYAEEMTKDCEGLPRDIPSYIVIDWEATAENIKVDYTSVDFDGVTYWVR